MYMKMYAKKLPVLFIIAMLLSACVNGGQTTREQASINAAASSTGNAASTVSNSVAQKSEEAGAGDSTALNTAGAENSEKTKTAELKTASEDELAEIEAIYRSLYIGELFESGYIYLEPFSTKRDVFNEKINLDKYPLSIKFYSFLSGSDSCFAAQFDSIFSYYVPAREESSSYFLQAFSEPEQHGLRYKLQANTDESLVGITLSGYEISNNTISNQGRKRPYSPEEHKKALSLIEKDKEIPGPDRTLDFISLENTIAGAEQICLLGIKDTPYEVLFSKYFAHTSEYTANVYVADFIKGGEVAKTYEKYNWDGPY
ncbi:hypothetical protein CLHUN_27570 [Ruminiclostridium hungatei]|uniref:Uncharacterized protein n=1 Tax=Ruminiclostridium hungatei TaxID=48256 RepID=A0A1V4SHK1_RUMHU|nr:hypothetical protein [Ruminiclostridium hungatei]OPX43412.1 hypothetical protein CLHUN_27570 [Ruminiclostridium hungatei]